MAKQQHPSLDSGINQARLARSFLYALPSPDIVSHQATKKGNATALWEVNQKPETMKSYQILKNEAEQKLKQQKKENALGVISKSIFSNSNSFINRVCRRAGHKSFQS